MSKFVSALSGEGSDVVVTVSRAFAESNGLEVVNQPALDGSRPLGPRPVEKPTKKKTSSGSRPAATDGGPAASKPEEASK